MKKAISAGIVLLVLAGALWRFDALALVGLSHRTGTELVLYGNVDIRQVALAFRVGGRISESLVDEGDDVRKGDVIARLDRDPHRYALLSAEANASALRSTLDKLRAGPRKTEIAQARAAHDESVASLKNASVAYDRARRLRPQGTISEAGLDDATAARAVAAARADVTDQALAVLLEGTRIEDIATAAAQLKAGEATLSAAQTSLDDTDLRAPNDGVILSRVREAGAIVSPADVAYVLSLTRPVWVRTYIAETSLGKIHPGMKAKVSSDTDATKQYDATVGFISPVAEFTPKSVETPELRTDLVYRLRVVIDLPDPDLRQGMPVTVRFPSVQASGQ
ncbi:secretion protein HlyD [Rhizobium sp. Root1220]|uniref:secretion protein HlyD n=1 Tax=Rhizobium sp. Root1220 TaxID=1736432 RepID=UPI000700CE8D|nr:secretion protein HlyD [Rhizobium sp. Root1220]KQV73271.1 secretion protein HlyD [Rhizobium sp. Root1220]